MIYVPYILLIATIFIALTLRHKLRERSESLEKSEQQLVMVKDNYAALNLRYKKASNNGVGNISMLNLVTIPIWVFDDEKIIYCNQLYTELVEDSEDNIKANNIEIIKQYDIFANIADSPQTMHERVHLIVGGKRIYYQVTRIAYEGYYLAYANDLSELEEQKSLLSYNTQVQSQLLEHSANAIAIYDSAKNLTYYNVSFLRFWQLDESFLAAKPYYGDVLEKLRASAMLPEQADFSSFKRECLSMFENLLEKYEDFYYLPDGRVLRVIIIPTQDGGLMFSYEDMTTQFSLERDYNTLLSVQKSTIDNLDEGVAVIGENGRLQLSNPTFKSMWNFSDEFVSDTPHIIDIISQTKEIYNDEDNWGEIKRSITKATNEHSRQDKRIYLKDETLYNWSAVPLPDGATLMTYVDMTDSALLEKSLRAEKDALEEAHNVKIKFLTNVSNELRSPLTSIKGFAELLLEEIYGKINHQQREYVEDIYQSSLKLADMIGDILDITSIESGSMALHNIAFDMAKTVHNISRNIDSICSRDDISFNTSIEHNKVAVIMGDEKRLRQAINVISNHMIRIMRGSGSLEISSQTYDNYITLNMQAESSNLSDKDNNIISNLIQLSQEKFTGTELNLTIAKKFIELHEGIIETNMSDDNTQLGILIKFPTREL